jgi:Zn finger protein HypA/HybF involved in hydrogenase expression
MVETKTVEGYCVKCKAKRDIKDPKNTTIKGRAGTRPAVKGTCPKCGTGMFRIGATI